MSKVTRNKHKAAFYWRVNIYTSKVLRSPPWLGWPLWNICVTNNHRYVPLIVNTSRSFPHSWFITRFVTRLTRRVSLVEQELPTLPEHLSSPSDFSGLRVTQSLVLCVCFVDLVCPFVLFLLAIVLSVLLWYTDSNYPFGTFNLFLHWSLLSAFLYFRFSVYSLFLNNYLLFIDIGSE